MSSYEQDQAERRQYVEKRREAGLLYTNLPNGMSGEMQQLMNEYLPELQSDISKNMEQATSETNNDHANDILGKKSKFSIIDKIKEKIIAGKKEKMRTVKQYLCDVCDGIINNPRDGFVIQGNIYVADPTKQGGLVGDNFPRHDAPFSVSEVSQTVLCKTCFLKELGISETMNTPNYRR